MSVCDVLFQGPYGRRCPIDHQCCPARVWGRPCKAHVLVNRVFLITDKDKVHHRRPNICYIFEKQRVLGYQIWLFCTIPPGGILMGLISKLLTQHHQVPSSTALYWPSTIKYQPVLPYTESVLLTQYHQVPTSTALYWPSTIKYQPVPSFTDPVPSSTNQYRPLLSQYYWPSNTKYQLVSAHVDPYLKTIFGDLEWFGDVLG